MSEGTIVQTDTRGELIGRLKSKLKEFGTRLGALEAERDAAVKQRDAAQAAATDAETKFNAEPLKGEVERLKGELREKTHRTVFDRLAAEKGVAKDALDLLYQNSGYKADKDEADEKAIGVLIDDLKAKPGVSRLFGEGQAPPPPPAPGGGQGGRPENHGSKFRVTQAQLRDPEWCAANNGRRAKALREGTLEIVD
jgi:hypothetical protein